MQRRRFIRSTAFTAGFLSLSPKDMLAALLQEPAFKIKMLRNDVGVFTERGGTIAFYLSKEGIVVVDSQFPDQSKHLIDELKKNNTQPFKLLINTHHHGDHSGGNISFKGIVEHVLAHENSKINQQRVAIEQKKEDQNLLPDQTFKDTWSGKVGGENISMQYYGAAHTNGDAFIHFENANIVHTGDLVANRRHPFVDRSAGANVKNWIQVVEKGMKKYDKKTIFVFGHAGEGYDVTGNADDLAAFRDYLSNLMKFVEGEIKAGKTKEEVIKATTIPGVTEWKGDGLQRPLTAIYEELSVGAVTR